MPGTSRKQAADPNSRSSFVFLQTLIGGLVCWRWLFAPEGSVLGETAWVTLATLLVPVLWGVQHYRGRAAPLVWKRLDSLFWLVIAGHWISCGWMWHVGGDLRAGLNLCWEWTSLGCLLFGLRQTVRSAADRADLWKLVLTVGVCFAGLGLWQASYQQSQLLAEYTQTRDQLDLLQAKAQSGRISAIEAEQLRDLQLEFQRQGVPLEGPGRMLFEQRLRDGGQPTGRWALANTFAGFMAVLLVCCLGIAIQNRGKQRFPYAILFPALLFVVVLWLTHSRTALVATLCGVGLLILQKFVSRDSRKATVLKYVAGVGTLIAVLAMFLFSSEASDRIESSYALRSVEFRLQYWQASFEMLLDRPIFGTGPGNFRQHYLAYKLPESSEQIADPHNFLLDLWANGGLLSLVGWIGFLFVFIRQTRTESGEVGSERSAPSAYSSGFLASPWILGGEIALVGTILGTLGTQYYLDWQLITLAVALPLIERLFGGNSIRLKTFQRIGLVGAVVLSIHLLGAGGIEMPGVVVLFLILATFADSETERAPTMTVARKGRIVPGLVVVTGVCLAGLCFISMVRPVQQSRKLVESAEDELALRNDVSQARKLYKAAIAADPMSPAPPRTLARLEFGLWQQDPQNEGAFSRGLEALEVAHARDPWSGNDALTRAELFWRKYQRNKDPKWAEKSLAELKTANQRIRGHERIYLLMAYAADAAGFREKAVEAAEIARDLDEINRKKGHWERGYSAQERSHLEAIQAGKPWSLESDASEDETEVVN